MARLDEEAKNRAIKERMLKARKDIREADGPSEEFVFGMQVDMPKDGDDEEEAEGSQAGEEEDSSWKEKKRPERKTKQQRRKADKVAADVSLSLLVSLSLPSPRRLTPLLGFVHSSGRQTRSPRPIQTPHPNLPLPSFHPQNHRQGLDASFAGHRRSS